MKPTEKKPKSKKTKTATTSSEDLEPKKKRKYVQPVRKVKLADGEEVEEEYHAQYMRKEKHPEPIDDPEKAPPPQDEASKHKYPPPKNNPIFRAKWMRFIDGVVQREKFKLAHLDSLEVLCDLYVDYEEMSETIRRRGRTYDVVTRFGTTVKLRPEVELLDKVRVKIKDFTKLLDLFPKKDHVDESGGGQDEWS